VQSEIIVKERATEKEQKGEIERGGKWGRKKQHNKGRERRRRGMQGKHTDDLTPGCNHISECKKRTEQNRRGDE
jgi:hypothetical protein